MTTFDARDLARGWLSVALASRPDKDRPVLNNTICVESFATGARLVATDSYVLLYSWVPFLDDSLAAEPTMDEAPVSVAVAYDPHGRGRGFMAHLLSLATGEDAPLIEVRLQMDVTDTDPQTSTGTFEGMEATYVMLEHPDHERLKLHAYEGEYPPWRKLFDNFRRSRTDAIALGPEIIGRIAKLGKLHEGRPLIWRFGGREKMALLEVADSQPAVVGAVMPVRWDLDRNAPADDPE